MADASLPAAVSDDTALTNDLVQVIDNQVKSQSGLSGAAVKAAYATVNKVKPGVVATATSAMLPDFLTALSPLWDSKPAGTGFGAWLTQNSDQASEALLEVTDKQADSAPAGLSKAYHGLRGKAKGYVTEALGPVGDAIEKNAAA
ncbi:MAG: hypothetical protein QM774_09010 [Gordonia sp. (in: high G+C Gram-positive bacteria)]|uniref:DUF6918 family protein n=1 Tax=Gordonia sp. (in: high G+C Gram-positive bacteria) TaxID=84139 RepID=UPI0039E47AD3